MRAIAKTGFFIPAELAGKFGELQATTGMAADRLSKISPHLTRVLAEWSGILRGMQAVTIYEPVPPTEEIEVVA